MEGFISTLAASLYERYGDDISSLNILFPSRRARLFFCDALSRVTLRPVWQPHFASLDQIMRDIAGITPSDNIKLITELYKVYSRYHNETFDAFFFWGEMLLADFDSIDKYMIDADMLFANIRDLRTLESDLSYLTAEQIGIIKQFWRNFGLDSHYSDEKEHFIMIWRSLSAIYHEFRGTLQSQGLAYTGMIYRIAAEKIRSGNAEDFPLNGQKYVVAGFNALSECEKILFGWLGKNGNTEFYWDYDNYYVGNCDHEAGHFLRENLRNFPAPSVYETSHDNFVKAKEIVAVDAPSDSLQCKYVYAFLQQLIDKGEAPGKETAIVLTDETLLQPVLYSIPEQVKAVNVTMGYPLRQTTAYSFVERLIELQSRSRSKNGQLMFYHSDVEGILNHPYVLEICAHVADDITKHVKRLSHVYVRREMLNVEGILGRIFHAVDGWESLSEYLKDILSEIGRHGGGDDGNRREFFTIIIDNIIQVENSLKDCGVEVTKGIFASLLRKVLQGVRIPYEGEPLDGIQIMGILETRNLDFKNVLVLSVNDDTFPGNRAAGSSFIPYNLRIAYGLPTPREHESVYGYYFYRAVQRADVVHLAYCSGSDEKRTGEPSRYIYQLMYESPHDVKRVSVPLNVNLTQTESIIIEKTGEVFRKLSEFLNGGGRELSPTSFYNYIECPLKFYLRSIENLRPEDEVGEDIDLPMFGTILHKAMELLYADLKGIIRPQERIRKLIGSVRVSEAVNRAVNEKYLHEEGISESEYGGSVLLVRDIVCKYINGSILPFDAAQEDGFVIKELEKKVTCRFAFASSSHPDAYSSPPLTPTSTRQTKNDSQEIQSVSVEVVFSGMADRIDLLESGVIRVVDYKTGASHLEFRDIEALFSENKLGRNSAVLQALLYSLMLYENEKCNVLPTLYYVRQMNNPDFSPLLIEGKTPILSFLPYYQPLKENLQKTLCEMFDVKNPFIQCSDKRICEYCDYREICRR